MDDIVNLCFDRFMTHYDINCVTSDGLGLGNLLSLDAKERARGLQVERFVRPPVCISLTFKVPVYVTHVIVKPYVEDSCKVQLTIYQDSTRAKKNSCGTFVYTSDPVSVVLCNRHWSKDQDCFELPTKVIGSLVHAKLLSQKIVLQPLKIASATSILTINISHWSGPKSIAIQCLEVWGMVGRSISYEKKRIFNEIFKTIASQDFGCTKGSVVVQKMYNSDSVIQQSNTKHEATITSSSQSESDKYSDPNNNIPVKFLDSITYNLMTLPVLLPSGHYVDQSTVDKIHELDIMYGRVPSDPFTGVPYSKPPSFSPQMKSEIDHYLSSNPELLRTTERTVGSSEDILKHQGLTP